MHKIHADLYVSYGMIRDRPIKFHAMLFELSNSIKLNSIT